MMVSTSNLRTVEKKVLGAMLIMANDNMEVEATTRDIANIMGYKTTGGAITFAIQALEMKNYIVNTKRFHYKVLV